MRLPTQEGFHFLVYTYIQVFNPWDCIPWMWERFPTSMYIHTYVHAPNLHLTQYGFLLSIVTLIPTLSVRAENILASISLATSGDSSAWQSTPIALLACERKQEWKDQTCNPCWERGWGSERLVGADKMTKSHHSNRSDTHSLWDAGFCSGGFPSTFCLLLVRQTEGQYLQQVREHLLQQLRVSCQNMPHGHQVPGKRYPDTES